MKFILELDKDKIISFLNIHIKKILYFLYGWFTTDGEILGYILGIWHILIAITILFCIFLSHTFFPYLWFQVACFICLFCIWLQHIFLHVCVVFLAEVNLTKKHPPFYTILENLTNTRLEETNILIISETTAVICFFLELFSKFSSYILTKLNNS
jgi:hypothetical protein